MELINAKEGNFDSLISEGTVLVDFFATWCGPCRMMSPVLEELASDRTEVKIVKVDIDQSRDLADKYGIMSVPTLILFQHGQPVSMKNGFLPKPLLVEWIEKNK